MRLGSLHLSVLNFIVVLQGRSNALGREIDAHSEEPLGGNPSQDFSGFEVVFRSDEVETQAPDTGRFVEGGWEGFRIPEIVLVGDGHLVGQGNEGKEEARSLLLVKLGHRKEKAVSAFPSGGEIGNPDRKIPVSGVHDVGVLWKVSPLGGSKDAVDSHGSVPGREAQVLQSS